jgi:hypothetical protein
MCGGRQRRCPLPGWTAEGRRDPDLGRRMVFTVGARRPCCELKNLDRVSAPSGPSVSSAARPPVTFR